MFENTFNYLKNIFVKNQEENKEKEDDKKVERIPNEILLLNHDYSNVALPKIVNETSDKSLLIVDDYELTSVLYENDFVNIKEEYKINVEKDFKVIRCLDKDSGLQAFKIVYIDKVKIDYALLDLTLGCLIKLPDNQFAEVDGADLGIYIKQFNPDAKIAFITMHTMNLDNFVVTGYRDKLAKHGINLLDHYINKNGLERYKDIYNFLYKK